MPGNAAPQPGDQILLFDGVSTRVEIGSLPEYSVPPKHKFTASAWVRRDVDDFPNFEQNHYVHWLSKGEAGKQEWVLRMYGRQTNANDRRDDWTSFYVFNPGGERGTGSRVEETINRGEWIHIVGVADVGCTHIYRNGAFKDCDIYRQADSQYCTRHVERGCNLSTDPIVPEARDGKLRIGSRDRASWFLGAIAKVRIWQRILTDDEIRAMYEDDAATPRNDLVAEFLLNEGSGTVAHDSSGNANHGTISGGTWAMV